MNTIFYVIEFQTDETGNVNVWPFADRADAEAKYHTVLMYASKSQVRKHGAMIITDDLFMIKSEVYDHEAIDPVANAE